MDVHIPTKLTQVLRPDVNPQANSAVKTYPNATPPGLGRCRRPLLLELPTYPRAGKVDKEHLKMPLVSFGRE